MKVRGIRQIIEDKGMTRMQLSHDTRLNPGTINKLWFYGEKDINIELDTLAAIAKAIGVSVSDLLVENEK